MKRVGIGVCTRSNLGSRAIRTPVTQAAPIYINELLDPIMGIRLTSEIGR